MRGTRAARRRPNAAPERDGRELPASRDARDADARRRHARARVAGRLSRRLLRGLQAAHRGAAARVAGVHPQARADAVRAVESGVGRRRRGRHRPSHPSHPSAEAGHPSAAREVRGAPSFVAARPQPPAVGVLRDPGSRRRPRRALHEGPSRGHRRPGRRRARDRDHGSVRRCPCRSGRRVRRVAPTAISSGWPSSRARRSATRCSNT